jgi:extracellular factor (EF) 3-hydroxypalmitic acid methyl ester biosynthesis protein
VARTRNSQRLRAHRVSLAGALAERVHASARHPFLGELEASVLDVSSHSARLRLEASKAEAAFMVGERLDSLRIRFDDKLIYQGAGKITRARVEPTHVELGVVLESAAVALDQLERLATHNDAAQRWASALEACSAPIASDFRSWVSELKGFFATAQSFLDGEQAAVASFDLDAREMVSNELLQVVSADIVRRMERASRELGSFVAELPKELSTRYRELLDAELGPYIECSPFLARARKKPLGYAGDYEMMNMLSRDPREGATLFGKALNMFATQQASARANVNRIGYFSDKMRHAVETSPGERARVVGLGAGPAKEVARFFKEHIALAARLEIALIDQEERAIAHCERALSPLAADSGAHVRMIKESARRLLSDRELSGSIGECDLAYSPGLFDYLADRSFSALLAVLYGMLRAGGWLVVGNVSEQSPDRYVLEYLADWHLHYRSPDALRSLAGALSPTPTQVSVEREPSGVNLFLVIVR